jgi:ubiquitin-protein ligase/prolyl-tRNA editing enzyme YbaK/EbsC (Cys-tRNA(Pro) deacylase)
VQQQRIVFQPARPQLGRLVLAFLLESASVTPARSCSSITTTAMASAAAIFREVAAINRKSVFDDEALVLFDEERPTVVRFVLSPATGPYRGCSIPFVLTLPADYPASRPSLRCESIVYHPNISRAGDICLNILSSDWNQNLHIVDFIQGMLWLLQYPNCDSRLNGDIATTMAEFLSEVVIANAGGSVRGVSYDAISGPAAFRFELLSFFTARAPLGQPRAVAQMSRTELCALVATLRPSLTTETPPSLRLLLDTECDDITFIMAPKLTRRPNGARVSQALGIPLDRIVKAVVFCASGFHAPYLAVTTADRVVDVAQLAAAMEQPELVLAKSLLVSTMLRCSSTSVAPFQPSVTAESYAMDEALRSRAQDTMVCINTGVVSLFALVPLRVLLSLVPAEARAFANVFAPQPVSVPAAPAVEAAPAPATTQDAAPVVVETVEVAAVDIPAVAQLTPVLTPTLVVPPRAVSRPSSAIVTPVVVTLDEPLAVAVHQQQLQLVAVEAVAAPPSPFQNLMDQVAQALARALPSA